MSAYSILSVVSPKVTVMWPLDSDGSCSRSRTSADARSRPPSCTPATEVPGTTLPALSALSAKTKTAANVSRANAVIAKAIAKPRHGMTRTPEKGRWSSVGVVLTGWRC